MTTDVVEEGRRLLELAERADVPLRLLGGVAIRLRTPNLRTELVREYGDLDFVAASGSKTSVSHVFADAGYVPDQAFNTLHGKRRLMFRDLARQRKADVFVGAFEMCHRIPVEERLELEPLTLPLAELLVTKLQIVELNEKDVRDALVLLAGHEVAMSDGENVNAARVGELCAADWGLWRTLSANLAELRARAAQYALPSDVREAVERRVDALVERIESEPKSRAWRLRARIGERIRWYDQPEDV